jgi:hypothetical protein
MKTIDMGTATLQEQPIRAVCYGEAGAGKTHLMREFPKPLILYDFDGKYEPLIGVEGITVKSFFITEAKESKEAWLDFWAEYKKDKKDPKIKTMVLDSLTSLDSILLPAMLMMMGKDPTNRESRKAFMQPAYGELLTVYGTLFDSFKAVGKHVIVLAHERKDTDDKGSLTNVSPFCSGQMKDKICAIFKDTWYLETKGEGKNMRRILHYKKFKLRTATSVLMNGEGQIQDPTYEKIVAEYRK